ncbi:MAG: AlwI family type II restriction endonuclease [Candidatus Firestonebacteria bacterium]
MIKLWSISTTVRNPERIRDFLKILKIIEGQEWTRETQKKYQILLFQHKLYGYGSTQFYSGLSDKHQKLLEKHDFIDFNQAKEVLESKKYMGGIDIRGRMSFEPLEKLGLVYLNNKNRITLSAVGNYFLEEEYDLGNIFLKAFMKWQLPNPNSKSFKEEEGFNIKPFIITLRLIQKVNKTWPNPVGISKEEFSLFIPTLINYSNVDAVAKEIINLRTKLRGMRKLEKKKYLISYKKEYIQKFLNSNDKELIEKTIKNNITYTDNIIRYFRLTRFFYIRGNGYYIDLEPKRSIEINSIIKSDPGKAIKFKTRDDYIHYLSDIKQPLLPWETIEKLKEITHGLINNINEIQKEFNISTFTEKNYNNFTKDQIKKYIEELRTIRRDLQERNNYEDSKDLNNIKKYIGILKNDIYKMDNRPIALEKYITLGLNSLNDALKIKPNYPVGDDNEPTNTARAGEPDIECFYKLFNSICEVTMHKNQTQWFYEGQPVMDHLRDFERKNPKKTAYCLFIAPKIHRRTINTFWDSVKHGFEGKKQKIIPITINQFVKLLEVLIILKENKTTITHENILQLYESILNMDKISDSIKWFNLIPEKIKIWKNEVLS